MTCLSFPGFRIELNLEEDEHLPQTQTKGLRVLVHEPGFDPFPDVFGAFVQPGLDNQHRSALCKEWLEPGSDSNRCFLRRSARSWGRRTETALRRAAAWTDISTSRTSTVSRLVTAAACKHPSLPNCGCGSPNYPLNSAAPNYCGFNKRTAHRQTTSSQEADCLGNAGDCVLRYDTQPEEKERLLPLPASLPHCRVPQLCLCDHPQ